MHIQISWLLKKPTDLDLPCLQRQGLSGFSRARVKDISSFVPKKKVAYWELNLVLWLLPRSFLGKIFSKRHFEIFSNFSLETEFEISTVSSKPVFWEN